MSDAKHKRIIHFADPINDGDAMSKIYIEQ